MSDDDLIRRGDARRVMLAYASSYSAEEAETAIAALPAVTPGVRVKPLAWENFDAWTYWAKSEVGTYRVKERNGVWKATLDDDTGALLIYEYTTDGLTPDDFQAAQLAAQADYEARILSALDLTPQPAPDVWMLVDALEAILEICVEPAETNDKNVRGWIEVTARDALDLTPPADLAQRVKEDRT